MEDNKVVPMGYGYKPRRTCSSGCQEYGNREQERTAQYARKSASYQAQRLEGANKRRAARKKQRQNKKVGK